MEEIVAQKKCSACKLPKPLSEFSVDQHAAGGHRVYCKECNNKKRFTCCECRQVFRGDELKRGIDRKRYCKACAEKMQGKKRCIDCKDIKDLIEFAEDRSRPDGHEFYCRECRSKQQTRKHAKKMLRTRETKLCLGCKQVKDIEEFFETHKTRDKIDLYCKQCRNEPKQEKDNAREYRDLPAKGTRAIRLISKYRMTEDDYRSLYEQQKGLCAICGRPEMRRMRQRLSVDHDHTTGKVRALLCNACNTGLGAFEENGDFLTKAIEYLKKHQ